MCNFLISEDATAPPESNVALPLSRVRAMEQRIQNCTDNYYYFKTEINFRHVCNLSHSIGQADENCRKSTEIPQKSF
jgi:hypothetical protein